jgi:penicillin amidase
LHFAVASGDRAVSAYSVAAPNWDRSQATNVPGQSGQPGSPYYSNLLTMWAENQYFPLAFSRQAVDAAAAHWLKLHP